MIPSQITLIGYVEHLSGWGVLFQQAYAACLKMGVDVAVRALNKAPPHGFSPIFRDAMAKKAHKFEVMVGPPGNIIREGGFYVGMPVRAELDGLMIRGVSPDIEKNVHLGFSDTQTLDMCFPDGVESVFPGENVSISIRCREAREPGVQLNTCDKRVYQFRSLDMSWTEKEAWCDSIMIYVSQVGGIGLSRQEAAYRGVPTVSVVDDKEEMCRRLRAAYVTTLSQPPAAIMSMAWSWLDCWLNNVPTIEERLFK